MATKHSRRRWTTRAAAPAAVVVAALALVAGGAPQGQHRFRGELIAGTGFSISGPAAAPVLYPGAPPSPFPLTVTNPWGVPITVNSVTVTMTNTLPAGCAASDFQLNGKQFAPSGTTNSVTVAPNYTVAANRSAAISPVTTLALADHGNQDACRGAPLSFAIAATATFTQSVGTTTALAATPNPAASGQAITLTATVTPAFQPPGPWSGTVTFLDGSTRLGNVAVNAGGQAQLNLPSLAEGSHSLTASFSDASGNFAPSTSSVLVEQVNESKKTSATTLTSSLNPSMPGQPVTFTATVSASGGNASSGTVTFYDGGVAMGPSTAVSSKGSAVMSTASLSSGTHQITAAYSGNSTLSSSVSSPLSQVVSARTTPTVAVSSSANPSRAGDAVTFTATVASSAGTPTGQVTFRDGTTPISPAVTLSNGSARFTTSALSAGSHTISVSYGGDVAFNPATSPALAQTVKR